jgi:uncharacterized protein (UPF0303 family)
MNGERTKDWIVITRNGTYQWSFVTHKLRNYGYNGGEFMIYLCFTIVYNCIIFYVVFGGSDTNILVNILVNKQNEDKGVPMIHLLRHFYFRS